MDTTTYGKHLIIDAYNCDSDKLQNINLIYNFLDTLPDMIGMKKIGPPQIAKFDNLDNAGVTGIIMIVTSHISIHTYSLKKCFFMDVFSCEDFDIEIVLERIKETFDVGTLEHKSFARGNHFPKENLVPW